MLGARPSTHLPERSPGAGDAPALSCGSSRLWILLLPWLWVGKGGRGGSLENRITAKRGRFLQVTCELLPPIPDPGRNFKSPPGSALATGSGSMRARGIFLLGLLALAAELQAAPTAGKYRRVGDTPLGAGGALGVHGWFGLKGPSERPQPSPAASRDVCRVVVVTFRDACSNGSLNPRGHGSFLVSFLAGHS